MVRAGSRLSSDPAAPDEALGPSQLFATRLDAVYCSCEAGGCQKSWASNSFAISSYAGAVIMNPVGGRCDRCGRTFCRNHAISTRRHDFACPGCRRPLDPALPPNGRPSVQTERLNRRLVHIAVLVKGRRPPSEDYLTTLFHAVAPDVFENDSTIGVHHLPRFNGEEQRTAMFHVGAENPDYLGAAYDLRVYPGADPDGRGQCVMAKVFEHEPKIIDPDAPSATS